MGDDLPDFEIMDIVGLPTCPFDAAAEIREKALYISDKSGGQGCVRDVIEKVLRLHGKWLIKEAFEW
jgi:3-deoxy-D-manno-octulosonate 8-phosphate phosphatase (KDO 8-P phosphatase)